MKLHEYINSRGRGSIAVIAKGINAPAPDVSRWASGVRPCPPWRCVAIEEFTQGDVTRQDLRPNDYKKHWPDLAVVHV